jgi:hypothetical protein
MMERELLYWKTRERYGGREGGMEGEKEWERGRAEGRIKEHMPLCVSGQPTQY